MFLRLGAGKFAALTATGDVYVDNITLNVPSVAISNVLLQKWLL